MRARTLGFGAAILIALAMALFVWPTRYRYTEMKRGSSIFPVRMDRVSGRTEYFDGEWTSDAAAPALDEAELRAKKSVSSTYSSDNPFAKTVTAPPRPRVPDEAEFEAWKKTNPAPPRVPDEAEFEAWKAAQGHAKQFAPRSAP